MDSKELTKAEEQVMHYLWELEKAFLKDIVDQYPLPKPAYTTVSTVIRVLVKKGFVDYNTYGKVHEYYPKIKKDTYFKNMVKPIIKKYFSGSAASLASYFAQEEKDIEQLEEARKLIDQQIAKLKNKS